MLSLNQLEVANTLDGPLLVIAGAGSGKTMCLVERVFNILVKKHISPDRIIITTFTEKAAKELKIRINKKIEDEHYKIDINNMYIGTMHSIWKRFISENISKSRFISGFSLMEDEIEQKFFIYSKLKEISKIDGYNDYLAYYNYLSNKKSIAKDLRDKFNSISENAIDISNISSDDNVILFLKKAYSYYEQLLIDNNIMDFAYLQVEFLNMLKNNEELLSELNEKIDYIMIDEYQDSNRIQEKIIFLLSGYKKNICVVGDEDQAIYRFRGATVENILNFEKNIGVECKRIFLSTNYRSNLGIVDFSKKWIESIDWLGNRFEKRNIESENITNMNSVYKIIENSSDKNAKIIVDFIKRLKYDGKISNYNQVAVLFSSFRDSFSKILEREFNENGIRVYSPRAKNFFNREEIKITFGILLACLKKYYDIKKILNDKKYLSDYDKYLLDCLNLARKEAKNDNNLLEYIKDKINNIEFKNFNELFYSLFQFNFYYEIMSNKNLDIVDNRKIYNLGILSNILKKYENHTNIVLNNDEIITSFIKYFFETYLKEIKAHGVSEFEKSSNVSDDKIQFLTIHESKGLEFPVVIVSSLYEKIVHEEEKIDKFNELIKVEEKLSLNDKKTFDMYRKFYVAFTRAKDLLLLVGVDSNISDHFRKNIHDIPKLNQQELLIENLIISKNNKENLTETFSYTQDIRLYKHCPLKYFFIRKARFTSYETKSVNLGIIAHKIIESINRNFYFYEQQYLSNLFEEEINKIIDRITKLQKIQLSEDECERITEMVFRYFSSEREYFGAIKNIESSEYFITDDFILYGEVDLVREFEDKYELIDFKTGKYNDEMMNHYKEQLSFYNVLLESKLEKKIESYLYYLEEKNSKIKLDINDEDVEKYKLTIYEVIKNIKEEKFDAINYEKQKCDYCEFGSYCHIGRN